MVIAMIEAYNIEKLLTGRAHIVGGYHVFSSDQARIEFINLASGSQFGPLSSSGMVVVTVFSGRVTLGADEHSGEFGDLDQIVIEADSAFVLRALEPSTVQVIWIPGFPTVTRLSPT